MSHPIIYDRGYRNYEGVRRGPAGARRAVYKDGIRRVLGLGRKARLKIFPWTLISVSAIAALIFVAIHWAIGNIAESVAEGIPTYGGLFDFYSGISLLFVAFSGPQLLAPDRRSGVLSVYFSRPLTVDGYLGAKTLSFVTLVGAIYLVPQLILHIGLSLIANDGALDYLGSNLDILWKAPVVTAAYVVMHGAVIFILSAYIDRTGIAAAVYLGIVTAFSGLAGAISTADFVGARWVSLLSLDQHPRIIRDWLIEETVEYPAEAAGFSHWASVAVIAALALLAVVIVRNRYRKLA